MECNKFPQTEKRNVVSHTLAFPYFELPYSISGVISNFSEKTRKVYLFFQLWISSFEQNNEIHCQNFRYILIEQKKGYLWKMKMGFHFVFRKSWNTVFTRKTWVNWCYVQIHKIPENHFCGMGMFSAGCNFQRMHNWDGGEYKSNALWKSCR